MRMRKQADVGIDVSKDVLDVAYAGTASAGRRPASTTTPRATGPWCGGRRRAAAQRRWCWSRRGHTAWKTSKKRKALEKKIESLAA